ncbi:putative serine/threonine protein kinase [Tribonema minus]|uniref:Putative serine/threonine protein kinase n=1 Tax=Tribonema minus TaxID=303371 RepID=A0A835YYG5_9STRA|nr:putative serine/threonine protein kinase [Tribonema minus]
MAAARKTRTLQAHLSRGARAPAAAAAAARAVVVVACPDRADLLDAVTRALRRVSRRICDADVMTSDDGIALDRFEVELSPEAAALGDAAVITRVQAALAAQDAQPGGSSGGAQHDKDAPHVSPPPPEDAAAAAPPRTIPFEELELLETVGHGRFSLMRRALWRRDGGGGGMVVAVKCVEPPSGADSEREHALILGEFARELDIVRRLRHPHVCAFYGDAHAHTAAAPQHCLVFEYVEGGNLADFLRRQSARAAAVDGAQVLRLAGQIAEGMRYLHAEGIVHRDLKTANILLDAQGDVRIVDFGLSCFNHPGADLTAETGTYRYMAPEVIRHEPYSAAADVYSYGIVLWELLARAQPFEGLTPIQAAFAVARKGLRPTLPPATPPPLAQLVRACWAADPALRPSFALVCDAAVPALRAALLGE